MARSIDEKLKLRLVPRIVSGRTIHLLGTVKGLTRERALVRRAFERTSPDAVAVHIPPEQMTGLKAVADGEVQEMAISFYEEVYAHKLAKYGQVQVPPPSLVSAYRLARLRKIPVVAIDINDEKFADAFLGSVSRFQMLRHSSRVKKLAKKDYEAEDAETFVMDWDRDLTHLKGFAEVESVRERHMAERLMYFTKKFDDILAIVELERLSGIQRALDELGKKA